MPKFVTEMTADKWNGGSCEEEAYEEPTFEVVGQIIGRLDANTWTMTTLTGPGKAFLTVAGGEGQYVVILTKTDEEFWNLLGSERDKAGTARINIGGQEGDYPIRQVVDFEATIRATETFYLSGEMDSTMAWEREG